MGLSREFISISRSTGPLFVKDLMKQRGIKSFVYALRLDEGNLGQSFMDLGSYKEDQSKPIKWFTRMPYSQFWQSNLNGY